jgi:hypothetical protein
MFHNSELRVLTRRIAEPPERLQRSTGAWSRTSTLLRNVAAARSGSRATAGSPSRATSRIAPTVQVRAHQPVQLHTHAVDCRIGAQHLLLDTSTLIEHHHVGATL